METMVLIMMVVMVLRVIIMQIAIVGVVCMDAKLKLWRSPNIVSCIFSRIVSRSSTPVVQSTNVIKRAPAGPLLCGKPTLASTVPALCNVHFQKAQKNVAKALKDAGHNISSTSKPPPKLHVIAAAFVHHIQSSRKNPNDERAHDLMSSCSASVLEEFPDIIFAYGYGDKYSFVFKKTSRFYQRRASMILSLLASFLAAVYVTKWKEFFPQTKLEYAPSFSSKVISCASAEVLQAYLAWRQQDCHVNNQYDTCFWLLVQS